VQDRSSFRDNAIGTSRSNAREIDLLFVCRCGDDAGVHGLAEHIAAMVRIPENVTGSFPRSEGRRTSVATMAASSPHGRYASCSPSWAVKTLFIEPARPWENGYLESFNSKMRDELLNREVIDTLWEVGTLCCHWVKQYSTVRRTVLGCCVF
jgi:hypothetical protein